MQQRIVAYLVGGVKSASVLPEPLKPSGLLMKPEERKGVDEKEWEELRNSRSPLARALVDKREKDIWRGLIDGGLTASALGVGVLGLKELAFNKADAAVVNQLVNQDIDHGRLRENFSQTGRSFEDALNSMRRYSISGSDAMNAKFFGMSPTTVLRAVRNTPFTPPEARWNAMSQDHYDGFSKGPLHAYLRYMDEEVSESNGSIPKRMIDFNRRTINDVIAKQTGLKDYINSVTSLGHGDRIDSLLSREEQIKALEALPKHYRDNFGINTRSLTSFIPGTDGHTFHKYFKPQMLTDTAWGMEASTEKYRTKLLGWPLRLHQALGPVGWAAALGGLGVAGLGTYKWNQYRKREAERKAKQISQNY